MGPASGPEGQEPSRADEDDGSGEPRSMSDLEILPGPAGDEACDKACWPTTALHRYPGEGGPSLHLARSGR
jgi:hypothetical protein